MTLIVTYITQDGIIHAADSNLSDEHSVVGIGCKVFGVPHLDAGLCVSGAFFVRGERLDYWLERFIDDSAGRNDCALAGFAEHLRQRLQTEMTSAEKNDGGSLIHLAGYVKDATGVHPEFYVIRNIQGIDPTGAYINIGDTFECDEEFWSGAVRQPATQQALASGGHRCYVNGFPPGRAAYLAFDEEFWGFLTRLWYQPRWRFRPPRTLEEREWLVRLEVSTITTLFKITDYPAAYVGGHTQTYIIAPPSRS